MSLARASLPIALLLAACSGGDAVAVSDKVAAAGGANCIDEFTQEFEETSDQPAPMPVENLCFDQNAAAGPPVYPASSRRVHLEYKNGDWYATQESAHWTFGDFDAKRRCTTALLSRTKVTAMRRGAQKESARLVDGKLARSATTGVDYGKSIPFGGGPGVVTDEASGLSARVESTPFGVDCTRVKPPSGPGMDLCTVNIPRTCAASRVLLPIDVRVPDPVGGTRTGKTVSLRTGAIVDPNSWVMP